MSKTFKNFKNSLRTYAKDYAGNKEHRQRREALLDDFEGAESLIEEEKNRKLRRKMKENLNY